MYAIDPVTVRVPGQAEPRVSERYSAPGSADPESAVESQGSEILVNAHDAKSHTMSDISVRVELPHERAARFAIVRRLVLTLVLTTGAAQAAQVMINGPVGSGSFGGGWLLPNGNLVVIDPYYDAPGPVADVGAVYLYRPDGSLISTLRGSSADDKVGWPGVAVLSNGNFVVLSPDWDNGAATNAGAVTFVSGTAGINGVVSPANSLVGSGAGDQVGNYGTVTALSNGNYVVGSPRWDNGAVTDAGASTFGSGTTGISGVISSANSLVGSNAGDSIGRNLTALTNGNYVVSSPDWDHGPAVDAGSVTFGSGITGISGVVSPANSLVGSGAGDRVGYFDAVTALSNGNYVVSSPHWDHGPAVDAGAVTFGSGSTGISGVVSPANSLVGSSANDRIGADGRDGYYSNGVTALGNGSYLVRSPDWDNGAMADAGAVTFGSGDIGISGVVSPANSLVGGSAGDRVGYFRAVTTLSNGNYVVSSPDWDHGPAVDAGAVTFGSGSTGISGVVSPANSLVGVSAGDRVGYFRSVTALSNGNYVVSSPYWDHGPKVDAGAVTFGSGSTGISGVVSPANSLVGGIAGDQVGSDGSTTLPDDGVLALINGNYVVSSPNWDHGEVPDAGAVTFGSGSAGVSGVVSQANSLVGSNAGDAVGSGNKATLSNGNYVVASPRWDNAAVPDAGAVTFGSGTFGISGLVSPENSLVGSSADDRVGEGYLGRSVTALTNGNYVVTSVRWDNGTTWDAGAVTFGSGTAGISGVVSSANSLVGSSAHDMIGSGGSAGSGGVTALTNGDYVISSPDWDSGAVTDAGAVTFGSGSIGISGRVSPENSLVGSNANDRVGDAGYNGRGVRALRNGNYAVHSANWDNGSLTNAGATTLGLSNGSAVGPITRTHRYSARVASAFGDPCTP